MLKGCIENSTSVEGVEANKNLMTFDLGSKDAS